MESELQKRLVQYELVGERLFRKYGMSFDDFKRNRVVEKEGYSFQAESDFWDWEMALDAIETVQEMLNGLKGAGGDC
jgi:hypothetical protein